MEIALLLARLALAVVFVVAGITKLADRAATRRAVIDFGVPLLLAAPVALALPVVEIGLAAGLLATTLAWGAALGVLALFGVFSAAIAVNLAHGRRPDCRCFGRIASAPIGWPTLARNACLAAVALFILWQGRDAAGYSAVAWLGDLTAAERIALVNGVIALGLGAAVIWLLVQRSRRFDQLLGHVAALEATVSTGTGPIAQPVSAVDSLSTGTPAPPFQLLGIDGETWTLDRLRAEGKPVLLVFVDPGCGSCGALLPDLGRWQRELAATTTVAIISRDTAESNRTMSVEHGLTTVLLQQDYEVADAYDAPSTPGAMLVRADGTIGSAPALGEQAVRALVASLIVGRATSSGPAPLPGGADVSSRVHVNGHVPSAQQSRSSDLVSGMPTLPGSVTTLAVGDPAPPLRLPDLSGRVTDLTEYLGEAMALVFWDPGSASCRDVLSELRAWEENRGADAPALVVVSSGGIEEIEAQGLTSTVLLDQGGNGARAFGASTFPAAMLIDDEGKVASQVAVSGPAVLELLRMTYAHGHEGRVSN